MSRTQFALALLAVTGSAFAAPASEPAAAASASGLAAAAQACQRAVQDTLRSSRGDTATASFSSPPGAVSGTAADAGEITVRGAGQVRTANGARPFSYSCSYDTRNAAVAGVVLRDAGAPERATTMTAPTEPDLSQISPAACESAAAGALKRRWPGVAGISFSAETRQLSQQARDRASLRGQGTAAPSLRDPAMHFSYDCDIDPRNGRIVAVRIAD